MNRPPATIFSALLAATLPLAVLASTAIFTSAPLQAQASTAHFTAELAQPTSETRAIAGGVLFACEGTQCTGPRAGKRPLRVCSDLRRKVGTIVSFSANGEALSEAHLARCNG